jgi:hypothetical protein
MPADPLTTSGVSYAAEGATEVGCSDRFMPLFLARIVNIGQQEKHQMT